MMSSRIMGDLNPAEELLRGLSEDKPKTDSKAKKKSEAKATKAKAERAKKENKYFRVNLALHRELGERIKAEAEAENRSVNNYVETILKNHFNREEN